MTPGTFTALLDPEVEEQVDQALVILEKGDTVAAESRLEHLLRDNPKLYITHYGMGTLHALKNELDQAQACFSRALEIFPYFALAWYNLDELSTFRSVVRGEGRSTSKRCSRLLNQNFGFRSPKTDASP